MLPITIAVVPVVIGVGWLGWLALGLVVGAAAGYACHSMQNRTAESSPSSQPPRSNRPTENSYLLDRKTNSRANYTLAACDIEKGNSNYSRSSYTSDSLRKCMITGCVGSTATIATGILLLWIEYSLFAEKEN